MAARAPALSPTLNLARQLLDERRPDEAAAVLRRIEVAGQHEARTLALLARIYGELGRLEERDRIVDEALRTSPDLMATLGGFGPVLGPRWLETAESRLRTEAGAMGRETRQARAKLAERRARPDEALALWRQVLAEEPASREARLGAIRSLRLEGHFIEADAAAAAALADGAEGYALLVEQARIAADRGDPVLAEARWLRALAADPKPAARTGWIQSLMAQHRFAAATAAAAQLAAAQPGRADYRLLLARIALVDGDYAMAESHFRQAAALDPARVSARLGIARTLELRGAAAAAQAAFAQVIAANPSEAEPRLAVASFHLRRAEIEPARRELETLIALDAGGSEAVAGLATCLVDGGDYAGAKALLNEALARWPHDPVLLEHKVDVAEAVRATDDAYVALAEARTALPHRVEPLLWLIGFHHAHGQREAAREAAELALAGHPRCLQARLAGIDGRCNAGEDAAARGVLEPLLQELPEHREVLKRAARLDLGEDAAERARQRWAVVSRGNIRVRGPLAPITRLDAHPMPPAGEEVRLLMVVHNERVRLPWLLDYYRSLGVSRFLMLDNGSDDGTLELLKAQPPDVHLFTTEASFAEAGSGVRWINHLLDTYASGGWCVTCDGDEALLFPQAERLGLRGLTRHLDGYGAEALLAPMLDMYPPVPLAEATYAPGQSLIEAFPCFDAEPLGSEPLPEFPFLRLTGGPRKRLFFETSSRAPAMEKVPLVRWSPAMKYTLSTHQLHPCRLARESGVLLHFKYMPDFAETARAAIARGSYIFGAFRYRYYLRGLEGGRDSGLVHAGTRRLEGSRQLVELGLMRTSPELEAHAASSA